MRISDWSSDVCSSDLGTAGHQAFSSNIFAMIGDLYPRRAVATVAGMGGMAGALGGIAIAQATGWTLQLTGSYLPILLYARSEERRVGKECVSTCRSRGSAYP